MSRKIKFIYFDLGKVLLHFDNDLICPQVAAAAAAPESSVREFLRNPVHQLGLETGTVTFDQVYQEFAAHLRTRPDKDRIRQAISNIFDINLQTVPIVASLFAANHRLGILSNTSEPHWEFIRRRYSLVADYFEVYALSYELKVMKPDPRIFAAAADLAGVEPQAIFFTDDRPENVEAALQAGWQAVCYTSAVDLAQALSERGVRFNY